MSEIEIKPPLKLRKRDKYSLRTKTTHYTLGIDSKIFNYINYINNLLFNS